MKFQSHDLKMAEALSSDVKPFLKILAYVACCYIFLYICLYYVCLGFDWRIFRWIRIQRRGKMCRRFWSNVDQKLNSFQIEPTLKYERLFCDVKAIFKRDAASCLAVHKRVSIFFSFIKQSLPQPTSLYSLVLVSCPGNTLGHDIYSWL